MLAANDTPARSPVPEGARRPDSLLEDKYILLRELGAGARGTVYEAEHLVVGKRVAVKVMHRGYAASETARARFVEAARAAARIGHANVVDICDIGVSEDGAPYVVTELLHGETLQRIVGTRGAVSPAYACELVLQVLAGLGAAHAGGVVHQDLRPANIVVTHPQPDRPLVKVMDFGIAPGIFAQGSPSREGVLGPPTHMAPEQALGRAADARSNVYAAGAILYELLAGEPPFAGNDVRDVLGQVVRGAVRPLNEVNPAVPRALCQAVTKAMTLKPSKRFQSAAEFAQHLWQYTSIAPVGVGNDGGGPPLPVIVDGTPAPVILLSNEPQTAPRDFPSFGLARVKGKPRGLPVRDSLLERPVIPKAPAPPKISIPGGFWRPSSWISYAPSFMELAATDPADETQRRMPSREPNGPNQWITTVLALLAGVTGGGLLALLMQ